ncbi:MAG: MarR family transcriptional regulator [Bacteroidales bacterium]|nr:MarR family transcriptional regulator [Bacteroidales bacterium]
MYDALKLENQLCFRFYTVSRLITQAYGPLLDRLGVTYPQYLVLLVLWEKDAQPVNDIAKRLVLETNTVTPLLKRMEAEGLVRRTRGTTDARQVIVSLTEKGRRLQETAKDIPGRMGSTITCCNIPSEQFPQLAATLDSLIQALKSGFPANEKCERDS